MMSYLTCSISVHNIIDKIEEFFLELQNLTYFEAKSHMEVDKNGSRFISSVSASHTRGGRKQFSASSDLSGWLRL